MVRALCCGSGSEGACAFSMTERHPSPPPDEPTRQGPTLEDFEARLRQARRARNSGQGSDENRADLSGMGLVLRIGIEMVAAVAVGAGMGWLLDSWLGTRPWLMVVFFFLGSAAGILNVYRATGRIATPGGGIPQRPDDGDSKPE